MASAMYRVAVNVADRFVPTRLRPLWEHPTGPKTIFFWAPAMKWVCLQRSSSFFIYYKTNFNQYFL